MIRTIYELKCRRIAISGHTEEHMWRITTLWFWQSPVVWVQKELDTMGERILLDSLRKVR